MREDQASRSDNRKGVIRRWGTVAMVSSSRSRTPTGVARGCKLPCFENNGMLNVKILRCNGVDEGDLQSGYRYIVMRGRVSERHIKSENAISKRRTAFLTQWTQAPCKLCSRRTWHYPNSYGPYKPQAQIRDTPQEAHHISKPINVGKLS